MIIEEKTIVGNVVGENFKTAKIFENRGIDFCCGGNQSIADACKENDVDMEALFNELHEAMLEFDPETDYIKRLDPSELIDYIIKRHHSYVQEQIPQISQLLEKIADVHGDAHPEVFTIRDEFEKAVIALGSHLIDEEQKLFPYIKMMVELKKDGKSLNPADDFNLNLTLEGLIDEHTAEGDRFDRLSKLTNNFAIPEDVCNTYVVSFKSLKAFQDDLHKHVHLENNLLYPMAVKLEGNLRS